MLVDILEVLRKYYGRQGPPPTRNAFELVLWENVAYLVDERRRRAAFQFLKKTVGTRPQDVLAAPKRALLEVASKGGMNPERRAATLVDIAERVLEEFDGDLDRALDLPLTKAKRALKRFPGIGDPGAEKILLFTRTAPVLALESNGLRVLQRLGYGAKAKAYATAYRSSRDSAVTELPESCEVLIETHFLLKRHGQETCRRNRPGCEHCPVQTSCAFGRDQAHS